MDKNRWFFWVDRLHITASERYFVIGLIGLYMILWVAEPLLSFRNSFDDEYYAPLMEVFAEHTADRYEARIALLEQYYPGQTDTIAVLAEQLIPPDFVPVVHEVLRRRSILLPMEAQESLSNTLPAFTETQSVLESTPQSPEVHLPAFETILPEQREVRTTISVTTDKININTATLQELTKLPGIGPSIAERIVQYRVENGAFVQIEDIMKVRGIGRTRFEQIRHLLEV